MADADVNITAGSGTKIDTRTVGAGTDEHRQVIVIGDPTTAASTAAVKAASTAAAATDPSLVVALSPNSPIPAGTNNIGDVDVLTLPTLPAGTNNIGDVDVLTLPNVAQATAANLNALAAQGAPAAQANSWFVRPRKLATYRAVYRPAIGTRPTWLANAFGAAGRKQYATIHHAATATKTVRLRRVRVAVYENTVASFLLVDLIRITTAPVTGNPAITPGIADNADAAAEATCLALPGTAATEGTVYASQVVDAGVMGGAGTSIPNAVGVWQELLVSNYDDESKAPVIRASTLEGWAVTVDSSAASNPKVSIEIEFTEE